MMSAFLTNKTTHYNDSTTAKTNLDEQSLIIFIFVIIPNIILAIVIIIFIVLLIIKYCSGIFNCKIRLDVKAEDIFMLC